MFVRNETRAPHGGCVSHRPATSPKRGITHLVWLRSVNKWPLYRVHKVVTEGHTRTDRHTDGRTVPLLYPLSISLTEGIINSYKLVLLSFVFEARAAVLMRHKIIILAIESSHTTSEKKERLKTENTALYA